MKIVDLRKQIELIDRYIYLRNQFCSELLTNPVTQKETLNWLANYDVIVLLAVEKKSVIGACILHTYRNGELSLFIEKQRKGTGTLLLQQIEKIAKIKRLSIVYAWVDEKNIPSNNFFQKNEFTIREKKYKEYKNKKILGTIYQKTL